MTTIPVGVEDEAAEAGAGDVRAEAVDVPGLEVGAGIGIGQGAPAAPA